MRIRESMQLHMGWRLGSLLWQACGALTGMFLMSALGLAVVHAWWGMALIACLAVGLNGGVWCLLLRKKGA